MKKSLLTLAFSLITLGSLSAQSFIGKLNPYPNQGTSVLADDTVKILAVMVNFQEDRDGATFGNGKFESIYSQSYGNDILDPLPHDKDYFESHLTFVKNYYQKVSNGKTNIEFSILPDTFSVSKTMRNYSPIPGSDDFTPMGNYTKEVWTIAAQNNPSVNFADYDLFLIFHAGVGRDISLSGSIGNERDLPSIYLSDKALREILNNDLSGLPVNRFGKYNSMIIPETESRELETLTGKFLFEITINGLIVASVASHLGLPDLFDTETGLSAIGRFGLMDGQSIFTYNGCFPPEPSAWEKIYLGWAEPIEISKENYTINLAANLAATIADTVILKVPINSSEYYLIENRQRDVFKDGANLTYKIGSNVINKKFEKDTTGFYSYDTDTLSGVVLDVDEFDWALPGNGIVIWHIDENIINDKLAENKINTDKTQRGVDVEEADGIQDIGEQFVTIFGDVVIGEGAEEDFWFSGNKAKLFKNKFSKDTRPDTKTNSGANSLITIKDFSAVSNKMSFKIEYGDSIIKPLFTALLTTNSRVKGLGYFEKDIFSEFIVQTDSSIIFLNEVGNPTNIYRFITDVKPAATLIDNIDYFIQPVDTIIYIIMQNGAITKHIRPGEVISTSPIVLKTLNGEHQIAFGTAKGKIFNYSTGNIVEEPVQINSFVKDSSMIIKKIAGDNSFISGIAEPTILSIPASAIELFFDNVGNSYSFTGETPIDLAITIDKNGDYISVVLTNQNNFYIIAGNELLSTFSIESTTKILSFSLVDLRKDGNIYISFSNGDKLDVRNFEGASADNYPVIDSEGKNFVSTPLAMDFEGDDRSELLAFSEDGRIFAFDGPSGRLVSGFPISSGAELTTVPILFSNNGKPSLASIDENNSISAWIIGSVDGKFYWSEKNGNGLNTSFVSGAESNFTINEFFPTNRAYNYPNPVYDGQTAIRYYVGEDSKINIKIFDLAGDFVAELNDDAQGGMDNETIWNVSDIQSGVYLTRIEAAGVSGKTESAVIKIAVVK